MFREMRRKKQQLSADECNEILESGKTAVLAVHGDYGYPYTIPINYVYDSGSIYFHCAKTGHKLDAIEKDNKVSVCVIKQDDVVQEKFTTYYKSVVCFGRAERIKEDSEIKRATTVLSEKYCPDCLDSIADEVEKAFPALAAVKITLEHITGKQCIELVK